MTLTIVIPVWNRADKIQACLRSIRGADDRPDWDIILVDDGSSDGSVAAIHATLAELHLNHRATVIEQANAGPGAARNTAVAASSATWFVCLDSDDIWLPWTLPTLLTVLDTNPQTDAGFMSHQDWDSAAALPDISKAELETRLYKGFFKGYMDRGFGVTVSTHNFLCRRSVFNDVGGFQTGLRVFEDSDFFLRLPLDCTILAIRQPLMMIHLDTAGSLTKSHAAVLDGLQFLRHAEARGEYPGGAGGVAERRIFLARVAQYVITNAWHNRDYAVSYGMFLRSFRELATNRCRLGILRYHRRILKDLVRTTIGAFSRS